MKLFSCLAAAVLGVAAVACGSGTEGQPNEFTPLVEGTIVVPTIPRGLPSVDPSEPYQRVESDIGYAIDIPNGWFDRGALQGLAETTGDVGRFYTATGVPAAQDALTVTCRSFETTPVDYANADAQIATNLGGTLLLTQPREIGGRQGHVIAYDVVGGTIKISHKTAYIQTDECTWRIDLSIVSGPASSWDERFQHIIDSFAPDVAGA